MDNKESRKPTHDEACTGVRILIVEDEDILGEMSRRILTRWGYEVVGVLRTGEEAVAQVETLRPNLVVMDVMLAGQMDGFEAARQVVARCPVPVFFMTGFSGEDVDALVAALGVPCRAVPKPIPFAQLREGIEGLLAGVEIRP